MLTKMPAPTTLATPNAVRLQGPNARPSRRCAVALRLAEDALQPVLPHGGGGHHATSARTAGTRREPITGSWRKPSTLA